jgi:2-polyprenyl-3-methyl-5-hydroxy-6-metoxy-1,4-benzoquinol methylase
MHHGRMNGFELYLLGRKLMKVGGDAMPKAVGFQSVPGSVQLILADVFDHPGTSITDIVDRTGLPQSLVSTSVSRLREREVVTTETDPADRRRTLVTPSRRRTVDRSAGSIDEPLAAATGVDDPERLRELVATLEFLARRLAGALPLGSSGFNSAYSGTPPWDIGRPQPAFQQLADAGLLRGRVLDVGCGTGEHALLAAALGLTAVGVDGAPAAIEIARRKASERNLSARFAVWNAFELAEFGEQFDTVLDCGLFHVFEDNDRVRYVDSLRAAIPPGGRFFLLCFSDQHVPGLGPRRVSQQEIRASFAEGWEVESIDEAGLETTIQPDGVPAWRASIIRT